MRCIPPAAAAFVLSFSTAVAASGAASESDSGAQPLVTFHEFSGSLSVEGRWYPEDAAHPGQRSHANGFVAKPELFLEDAAGRSFTIAPFLRYDAADPERTHADLHEAYLLLFGEIGANQWELRLGVDQVFWGVTESHHLVDIVNQVDLIEHPNEKARLGQPMVHLTWSGDWGAMELFGLTFHRARTFAGRAGRLRFPFLVDDEYTSYESPSEQWHLDFAARYSNSFGPFDIGASAFDGTSREPFMLPAANQAGALVLAPHYGQIRQLGLDAQMTTGSWLLKLEAIHRAGAKNLAGEEEDYAAFVCGGEYTYYAALGSNVDLSLIGEWSYDGRGVGGTNKFQNDVFVGTRPAFNDIQGTEILGSILEDLDHGSRFAAVEFNRRLSDHWSVHMEAVAFLNVGRSDLLYETRRDSFVGLDLTYAF